MKRWMLTLFLAAGLGVMLEGGAGQSIPMCTTPVAPGTTAYHFLGLSCYDSLTNVCSSGSVTQAMGGTPRAERVVSGSNGAGYSVKYCRAYFPAVDVAPGNKFRCAVYSAATFQLISNCGQTSDNTATVGWNETPMPSGCALAASTAYYVFVESSGSGTSVNADYTYTDGYAYKSGFSYGNWPSSLSGATTGTSAGYAFALKVIPQ